MRKLLWLTAFVLGCSSSNCKNGDTPEPTPPVVSVPDAGPTAPPTTSSPPADPPPPKVVGIDWTPLEELADKTSHHDLCGFIYFGNPIVDDPRMDETTFKDEELIKLVNENFLSVRFPVTTENLIPVMEEFEFTKFPTLIMTPGKKSGDYIIQIEGIIPPEALKKAIKDELAEGKIFEHCAEELKNSDHEH